MIPIALNDRVRAVEAGYKVVLTELVRGTAKLPDPIFANRLGLIHGFTREDFTNLYLKHVGGCPEPEFSIMFQSCINARYFSLTSPAERGLYVMTAELFWSVGHDTLSLGLLGALAFPPWVRSRLVHLSVDGGQGTGFLYRGTSDTVLTARHCVENQPNIKLACEGRPLTPHSLAFHRNLPVAKFGIAHIDRHGLSMEGQASDMSEVYVAGYPRLPILSTPTPLFGSGYIAATASYREVPSYIVSTPTPANPGNSGGPVMDKYGRVVAMIEQHGKPSDSSDGKMNNEDTVGIGYLPYLYATNLAGCNPDDPSQWEQLPAFPPDQQSQ
jgi:S1-C subfamily serine protease